MASQLTGRQPAIQTDFDFGDIFTQTNQIQDRLLEEDDRESVDFEEMAAIFEEKWWAEGDEMDVDGPSTQPVPGPSAPTPPPRTNLAPASAEPVNRPGGGKRSHQSMRRQRWREKNPDVQTKSGRLEAGRLKKARHEVVQTGVELKTLKPGLKLPEGCEKKVYGLEELRQKGFVVRQWDGL